MEGEGGNFPRLNPRVRSLADFHFLGMLISVKMEFDKIVPKILTDFDRFYFLIIWNLEFPQSLGHEQRFPFCRFPLCDSMQVRFPDFR